MMSNPKNSNSENCFSNLPFQHFLVHGLLQHQLDLYRNYMLAHHIVVQHKLIENYAYIY